MLKKNNTPTVNFNEFFKIKIYNVISKFDLYSNINSHSYIEPVIKLMQGKLIQ